MQPYLKLEKKWAKYNGKKYGVSTNTGTSALHLALLAIGVGKGDEVIVPDFSMAAAAFAVSYTGATPVFVDCDTDLNIDPSLIEGKITKNTKAILPVHIYGRLCDMKAINKIARKHKLWVIEDACEVHGAKVGQAHMTCFSFYQNKIVCAEEGGMVLTDQQWLADKMNYLKNMAMGQVRDYKHTEIGYNYRMSNANATIALESLSNLKANLKKRQQISKWYNEYLGQDNEYDVVWVYDMMSMHRAKILATIKGSRPYFVPMTELPMYKGTTGAIAGAISKYGLYLPVNPSMTKAEVKQICDKILSLT